MPDWLTPQVLLQGGAFVALLGVVLMVFRGLLVPSNLVPRSTLDDVRTDAARAVEQARKDAAEAIEQERRNAAEWRALYVAESDAHDLTRQSHAEELRGSLMASTETARVGVALLTDIRSRMEGQQ